MILYFFCCVLALASGGRRVTGDAGKEETGTEAEMGRHKEAEIGKGREIRQQVDQQRDTPTEGHPDRLEKHRLYNVGVQVWPFPVCAKQAFTPPLLRFESLSPQAG